MTTLLLILVDRVQPRVPLIPRARESGEFGAFSPFRGESGRGEALSGSYLGREGPQKSTPYPGFKPEARARGAAAATKFHSRNVVFVYYDLERGREPGVEGGVRATEEARLRFSRSRRVPST